MILSVTLNPCLDKTLDVPAWRPGDNVRGTSTREVVGGKGNNVARALGRLGRVSRPVSFYGGPLAEHCVEILRTIDRLDPIAIATKAATRVILTVRTAEAVGVEPTAFFDPDPQISVEEADALLVAVESVLATHTVRALTLSGSSPCRVTDSLFSDLVALGKTRSTAVFLDTYGPALSSIWGFWPEVMQLNRREAAEYLNKPLASVGDEDLLGMLDQWSRHGVKIALVTSGEGPVLANAGGVRYRLKPASIEVVNPIGSGDCLLAGLVDSWLEGRSFEETLRHGLACAAANAEVWEAGGIEPERVRELEPRIEIERLPS